MKATYRCVDRTKRKIRTAFVELIGEKKELQSVTVGEISKRADIAKSTFYNHYEDVYSVAEEFENELINELSLIFDKIESDYQGYEVYFYELISFLKAHEKIYHIAILSPDVKYFIEKLKSLIAQRVFVKNKSLPFSQNQAERYAQIRLIAHACVDIMVDYFRGSLDMTLDEVCNLILSFLNKLK